MIIQSPSKESNFIFFQFLKKKKEGTWEKTSLGEGKKIKCDLEEIIMILQVLKGKEKSWSTVHDFKGEKTSISVNRESDAKVWFNVGEYPKMLSFAQIEILRRLLEHILQEKIEHATVMKNRKPESVSSTVESNIPETENEPQEDQLIEIEEVDLGDKIVKITGY